METASESDNRAFERHGCEASVEVSIFNQSHSYDARIVNIGAGGLCFQSDHFLRPGATICIRLKELNSSGCTENSEAALRSMSLAQVKWCHELPGAGSGTYEVGVKYQAPQY